MPGFDGTGPTGKGPRTGRGLGRCDVNFRPGMGFGRGAGRGFGRFLGWVQPQTKQGQLQALKQYRQALEDDLAEVKKQEAELEEEE